MIIDQCGYENVVSGAGANSLSILKKYLDKFLNLIIVSDNDTSEYGWFVAEYKKVKLIDISTQRHQEYIKNGKAKNY